MLLNPPLAALSNELLANIVYHLAETNNGILDLLSLCLVDRVFTALCQEKIFESFTCTTRRESPWLEVLDEFQAALEINMHAREWVREIRVGVYGLSTIKNLPFITQSSFLCWNRFRNRLGPLRAFSWIASQSRSACLTSVLDVLKRNLSSSLTTRSLLRCFGAPLTLFHILHNLKSLTQ